MPFLTHIYCFQTVKHLKGKDFIFSETIAREVLGQKAVVLHICGLGEGF